MVREYAALAPATPYIPLLRYHLPRRSYRNPYAVGTPDSGQQALIINPHRPYRQALQEFLAQYERKLEQDASTAALGGPRRPAGIALDGRHTCPARYLTPSGATTPAREGPIQ
ncbi:MAG: hypothetical protein U5K56_07015 [Halioglobus sp.]|nr:hypothetical protein [Halioglobus sp.]